MASFRRTVSLCLAAAALSGSLSAATPAAAQWWGWGPGWGYGYNNGGAIAGAAIGGLAAGALLGAAIASQNQPAYYYDAPPVRRRARLCPAWQPIYDGWGNFVRYQAVRAPC
jgi:hypothetical protein